MADENNVVNFSPSFEDFIPLYRGIDNVRIDNSGVLYASYIDGQEQQVGPVSSYYYAVQQGFTGSFADWTQLLSNSTQNASDSEAYAAGTRNQSAVSSTDPAYHNNSKYYALNSESAASDSEAWANGTRNNVPVQSGDIAYNKNSKYYADTTATLAASVKPRSVVCSYQNSASPVYPSGTWTDTPEVIKGTYLWTRTKITWSDSSENTFVSVAYSGLDGQGNVNSVNGYQGTIVLRGTDIKVSSSSSPTIEAALTSLKDAQDFSIHVNATSSSTYRIVDSRITQLHMIRQELTLQPYNILWQTSSGYCDLRGSAIGGIPELDLTFYVPN